MENWLDKYKPSNLAEIIGEQHSIKRFDTFVKQFTKKKFDPEKIERPNIIITGTNGIGKTLMVDLALKENGLEKIVADFSNISVTRKTKKKKVEKEATGSNRTIKTYYLALKNNKKLLSNGQFSNKKIALVFDDVSNMSNSKEKEAIKSIIKINNKYKEFPIIIIANIKHSKIVNELRKMIAYAPKKATTDKKTKENKTKKNSGSKTLKDGKSNSAKTAKKDSKKAKKILNEIILKAPSFNEMEKFIKNICSKEKIKIVSKNSDDNNIYAEIIQHSQFDIRRLINILEELKLIYENDSVTYDKFEHYCETSKTKDLDPGIYEATRMLLNNYSGIDEALLLYGEERATIPLMVHENYPLNVRQQYPKMSVDDQIELIFNISKSISESDKIDGLIYSNQCWSLQPVHGFYSCALPSYYINQKPNKLCKMEKYKYTQDYNKTSIKKINNKVIKKAQENPSLKKVQIYDFLHMASILKTLTINRDFEKIAELMEPYKLKWKEIESIIKIDKINKAKATLTGKQKSIIKELMGVDE